MKTILKCGGAAIKEIKHSFFTNLRNGTVEFSFESGQVDDEECFHKTIPLNFLRVLVTPAMPVMPISCLTHG